MVFTGSGLSEHARSGKGASEWDLEVLMGDLKVCGSIVIRW
jgi:5-methylcytosine-specific restriction endonuclease McrA